jgi:uncharacterized Zn-binding protein involved in type VI secretion
MNAQTVADFLRNRLLAITALAGRVKLGDAHYQPQHPLPLATVTSIECELERRSCTTHVVTETYVVEGVFNAIDGDFLTPGNALLASFQSAICPADCDYTYGNSFIDLTITGRRVFPREDGSSIGTCQLRLVARYHEDF